MRCGCIRACNQSIFGCCSVYSLIFYVYWDFIPKDFMDLVPSQGAVLENECKDDEFLCEHTWKTVKDDVLKCIDCGDLCCVMCLNSCFKVRKCEITKMRQKKIPFTCVTCQVNEMSKKRTSKRKRKRRKKT
eukprot:1073110_1